MSTTERETYQRFVDHNYVICGAVDQVEQQIKPLARCHTNGALERFGWSLGQGFMPMDGALRQLELFANNIIPKFKSSPYNTFATLGRPMRCWRPHSAHSFIQGQHRR